MKPVRPAPVDGPLTADVRAALEAMHWLTDTDKAAARLAITHAERLDAAVRAGETEAVKAAYIGPLLLNVLAKLGGTPRDRREVAPAAPVGGKLAELRARHERQAR